MRLLRSFRESTDHSYRFAIVILLSSLAYLLILILQVYGPFYEVPPSYKEFYFWFSIYYLLIAGSSLALLVYKPHFYQNRYAPLLPVSVVLSAFYAGQLFFLEPMFSLAATVALTGVLILFLTNVHHGNAVRLTYFLGASVTNVIVYYVLNPRFAYLETTEVAHGFLSQISFVVITIGLLAYALYFFGSLARQREALIREQGRLIEEVRQMQGEAEARRAEAEARYVEAQHLQKELAREVARTALSARYEALMRERYGSALPDFLRALLEAVNDDLGFVAGLAYQEKGGGYFEVVATYALPQYRGRTFSGGILETAAALREPYLIAISTSRIFLRSIANLRPRYALYLPIYADVAEGKIVALLELLFLDKPDTDKVSLIGTLLPRIGSYMWMQRAVAAQRE